MPGGPKKIYAINVVVEESQLHNRRMNDIDGGTCIIDMVLNYSRSMNSWDHVPEGKAWTDYHGAVKHDQQIHFTYNNRMHSILNFKRELNNINRDEALEMCQNNHKGSSLFTFFTDEELRHVINLVTYHGNRGAPVLIFTGFEQDIKVSYFKY